MAQLRQAREKYNVPDKIANGTTAAFQLSPEQNIDELLCEDDAKCTDR